MHDHSPSMIRLLVVTGTLLVLSVIIACREEALSFSADSLILRAVVKAKAENASTTGIRLIDDARTDYTLDEILQTHVLLTATARRETVVANDNTIHTWYRLEVARQTPNDLHTLPNCRQTPPTGIKATDNRLLLPLAAGSIKVRGVTVKMESFQSSITLQDGGTYHLLVVRCPEGLVQLPLGASGVFTQTAQGTVVTQAPQPLPAITELLDRGSRLEDLERQFASRQPSPK